MCGTRVASGTPAASAARVGARVRMSETTTAGSSRSISGSNARAASAAGRASSGAGLGGRGGRGGAVFLGGGEVEPGALDRGAALLPGLDRDLVAAARQRPSQRDRREDVAGIAGGGDEAAHPTGRR